LSVKDSRKSTTIGGFRSALRIDVTLASFEDEQRDLPKQLGLINCALRQDTARPALFACRSISSFDAIVS
jgi:hypothetical protein